ncbi:MAG TPA: hypothetical protein VF717_09450 [Pyrinomonadaceae bacterium]|jgi:hypothetical protein
MTTTPEQEAAAKKVIEVSMLMQKCIRDAEKLGLDVSVSVYGDPSKVETKVRLIERVEVAAFPQEGKKNR